MTSGPAGGSRVPAVVVRAGDGERVVAAGIEHLVALTRCRAELRARYDTGSR